MIELALPLLEEAAGGPVDAMIGVPEPLAAIQDAINLHGFDEVIISTLPTRVSKWLQLDLPQQGRRARTAGDDRHRADRARARGWPRLVPRFWLWTQVAIVVFVLAGMIIALTKI